MENFIKIYSDLEQASDRVMQVLLRQCLRTLLNENLPKTDIPEFIIEDSTLKLKSPLLLEFRTYEHSNEIKKAFIIRYFRYRYQNLDREEIVIDALSESHLSLFEIKLGWDDEECAYVTDCSYFSSKSLRNCCLLSKRTAKEIA